MTYTDRDFALMNGFQRFAIQTLAKAGIEATTRGNWIEVAGESVFSVDGVAEMLIPDGYYPKLDDVGVTLFKRAPISIPVCRVKSYGFLVQWIAENQNKLTA